MSPNDQESGIFSVDGTFFPNFIPDSLIPSLARYNDPDPSSMFPEYTQYGALDNVQFDFDLNDGDFGLIDFYNSQNLLPELHEHLTEQNNVHFDADSGIAMGAEAYHRSSLSAWKPSHGDYAGNDHENLSIPQTIDSPEASVTSDRQILCERLSPSGRDRIFGMVLETSQKAHLSRIMRSFPSTDLLDGLIQQYFNIQKHGVDSWVHGPTFQPNEQEPAILGALAAAAAVRSTVPTIRKLGYSLAEIVRLYMPRRVTITPQNNREESSRITV